MAQLLSLQLSSSPYHFAYTSPAILQVISNYLSGYDILSLCMTCSKPLYARIRAGGAKRFLIGPGDRCSWPTDGFSMIKYFPHLIEISIHQSTLTVWKGGPKLFEVFPPTVQSITLCIPLNVANWLLIGADQDNLEQVSSRLSQSYQKVSSSKSKPKRSGNKSKKSRQLSPTVETMEQDADPGFDHASIYETVSSLLPNYRMATLFPNLNHLDLSGGISFTKCSNAEQGKSPKLEALVKRHFVSSLPIQMHRLSVPDMGDYSWTLPLSSFESLYELTLRCETNTIPSIPISFWPPQLVKFEVKTKGKLPNRAPDQSLFCGLPETLYELIWTHESDEPDDWVIQASPHSAASAPLLDCLQGIQNHPMRKFDFRISSYDKAKCEYLANTYDWLSLLPRRLESLFLDLQGCVRIGEASRWSSLPLSLVELYIANSDRCMTHWDHFPAQLKTISIAGRMIICDEDTQYFPLNLKTLSLNFSHISFQHPCGFDLCNWRDCRAEMQRVHPQRPLRATTDAFSFGLPPSLTKLNLSGTYFGDAFLPNLPPHITDLQVLNYAKLDKNCFTCLPDKLLRFSLDCSDGLDRQAFYMFPKGLTHLHIQDGDKVSGDNEFFKHLPRDLTYLSISRLFESTDQAVADLPRGLSTLLIPNCVTLSVSCLIHLPRSLTTLDVAQIIITSPAITRQELLQAAPQCLMIYDLPWVRGRGGRKLDLDSCLSDDRE